MSTHHFIRTEAVQWLRDSVSGKAGLNSCDRGLALTILESVSSAVNFTETHLLLRELVDAYGTPDQAAAISKVMPKIQELVERNRPQ